MGAPGSGPDRSEAERPGSRMARERCAGMSGADDVSRAHRAQRQRLATMAAKVRRLFALETGAAIKAHVERHGIAGGQVTAGAIEAVLVGGVAPVGGGHMGGRGIAWLTRFCRRRGPAPVVLAPSACV